MKSQLVALFIFAFLLMSMVKETDCFRTHIGIGTTGSPKLSDEGNRIKVTNKPSVFSFAFVLYLCFKHIDPTPLPMPAWLLHQKILYY